MPKLVAEMVWWSAGILVVTFIKKAHYLDLFKKIKTVIIRM